MNSSDEREKPAVNHDANPAAQVMPPILDEPAGYPPPRLGIIHLLAWTTVAAVLFGMDRSVQVIENASSHPDRFIPHYVALDAIHAVAMAAGVVGITTLIRWRIRRQPAPLAPGHWILIAEAIPMLMVYALGITWRVLVAVRGLNAHTGYLPVIAISALIAVAQLLVFAEAIFRSVEKPGWKWILGVLAVGSAAQATLDVILLAIVARWVQPPFPLNDFFYPAPAVVHGIVSTTTIAFAAYDAVRIRRDWLHGVGVALVFVNGLTWVGYGVASQLFRFAYVRDWLEHVWPR